ncbi:DUF2493 domain-containing protein [Eilatimonas milleporae]|uniref:Uncharacterized protein DUF2493 n=1 Tax=Eilatimonas milleporae TaxID=911205 RepID=A0A3M0CJH1_9PROT|nr:DUF2493 domain-containing protein [Eilatimonas milleporae]RMB09025.1 uncharacterized protein DUF2493 [Eilatimonas milleporae]
MDDHASIPYDHRLTELAAYGIHPTDDPDLRGLPGQTQVEQASQTLIQAAITLFEDSRLDRETEHVLWQIVNIMHRRVEKLDRDLDANELVQRRLCLEQDGSEVASTNLEDAITKGQNITEARNFFELIRDLLAEHFQAETGSDWRPSAGRLVNHGTMTAAMLESSDFLQARRDAEMTLNNPSGSYIGFTGPTDFCDVDGIHRLLDKVHASHRDMVLIHTGQSKGADLIATQWAAKNKITAIAFAPDWDRHGRAAPFKRNDVLLQQRLKGLIAIDVKGNGIIKNLVQKAEKLAVKTMVIKAPE